MSKYKLNLFMPMIIATLIAIIVVILSTIYLQESFIHESKSTISKKFEAYLNEKVEYETKVISEYINLIQDMSHVSEKFKKYDKDGLHDSVKKIYEYLNKNIDITHFYFIKPDGTVLLRVHNYDKDMDIIDRTTFKKAQASNAISSGLEFGVMNNYTLRVVKPWYVDNELIGYIEIGKEIDKLFAEISTILNSQIYIAIKKEQYKNASPEFMKNILKDKLSAKDHYIVYKTFDIPKQIEQIIDGAIDLEDIEVSGSEYFVSKTVVSDVTNKDLGYFILLNSTSFEHAIMYKSIISLIGILFFVSLILLSGAYTLIQKKEKNIDDLTQEINQHNDELVQFNIKLQQLFDLQRNIIITTDSKRMILANKATFDFFGFFDLDDFLNHHSCICDRFVTNDDFFHLGKVKDGDNWVNAIRHLNGSERVVAMLDKNMESHAFSVSVNEFGDGNYIVSFTDISNTVIEQISLKKKVTHDKLTNALNREFFDSNISFIINDSAPHKLAFVICDIDHFKRVNDTFGHNRGDIVLKNVVKIIQESIRQDDYLIRWGGEEFVILLKIDSMESLKKVLNHLREIIAKQIFEEVGHVTMSFGATLYEENERIGVCIERADKALYVAKESGRNRVETLEFLQNSI